VPLLPGMGGAGGAGTGGPERSDASGLLGGADEPWLEAGLADIIVAGAAAGGAGLAGVDLAGTEVNAETPEDIAAWDTGVAADVGLLTGTAGGTGPDDPVEDAGLAKWRPVPADPGAAPDGTLDAAAAAAQEAAPGLGLRSSGAEYTEPPDDATEKTAEAEFAAAAETAAEEETRGAAGLLVEDASLWGTWPSDPGALG
jgi:collagen type III alpha